jgi:hypothetical protein
MRTMLITSHATRMPVGGALQNSPWWVPRAVK